MLERLREVRKALGLNQTEFAKSLGINQSSYSLIEVGRISMADRYIKTICALYGIDEEWLLTGKGEMFAKESDELALVYKKLPVSYKKALVRIAKDFLSLAKEENRV